MPPHRRTLILVALAGLVWVTTGDPVAAKIIQGGRSNPAVEAGGLHPTTRAHPAVPYSLIGALAGGGWDDWRWHLKRFATLHHQDVRDVMRCRSFNALSPVRPVNWVQ